MPITETVNIKAGGSNLTRVFGFPLKESFNLTDISALRLKAAGTILPADISIGSRWRGLPGDGTKAAKWLRVAFKDTAVPRTLTLEDTGGAIPAQTNPLVVTNNVNDITVSNGLITAVFNKTTDSADLLTSFLLGATEVCHATNKPRISVPVDKRTATTWTSGSFDFAAIPADDTIKVGNASLFTAAEQVNIEWEGTVADYFPTGGADSHPFIIMAQPFTLPDMTRALMDATYKINIIIDYGGPGQITVPIDYSQSQGFCLETAPATTPVAGMKIRIAEVEATTTKTILSINAGANTITFTTTLGQHIPQGVFVEPLVPASSTAFAQIIGGGTTIEKQYGDKAVIIKQVCHLKDSGARIEGNLTIEVRWWVYADTGFIRRQVTLRNTVQTLTTSDCPPVLFKALNLTFPTALAATTVSDSVTDMATSVARYKLNNLHASLNHDGYAGLQFAVHEFQVQWPNIATVNAAGYTFEVFPASVGPISFEGGVIKSRNEFIGLNASAGHALLDNLGVTFDPEYVALTGAVRPNMVEKRDWNTYFAGEPQKFRDACNRFERAMSCLYDITQAEPSFASRPAMSLYEYRWDYPERAGAGGSLCFGWDRWGNTTDDVGFGNNRFDLPYILFREGLREPTLAKAELAFKLGLQQIRNRSELGQHWTHQSQASGTPDMHGLARYERAYQPDPFDYTNSPKAIPTHSWNEGTCLAWALTDEPLLYEAAKAGVEQARIYNYQGTANGLLYGSGSPQMGSLSGNGGGGAEPRFVGWPIHTLIVGYRYFGEAVDLQRAQEYSQSFIATLAVESVQDGFIDFGTGGQRHPIFQHGGYCVMGMIETWRDTPAGAMKTAIGDYIVTVAKWLTRGDSNSAVVTADAPMLTIGKPHPNDPARYIPASHMPFIYKRSFSDTLSGAILAATTTLPLTGSADTFNLPANVKRGALIPPGGLTNPSTWEFFTYTTATGTNLTGVVRGFDGTTAQDWPAGTIVYPCAFNNIENDLVIATIIMGARISGDATLASFAEAIWQDNILYSKRVDGGNPIAVTIGDYAPVNTWELNVSTNSLKTKAQAGLSLSEFLGDRVNPPTGPAISSLAPNSATAGAAQFTLTINGSNFASDAQAKWGVTDLVTTFVSATQVTAIVPAILVAAAGTASVTVLNVTDNLTSNGQTFTINPAAPTISGIAPNTAIINVATGAITITGTALAGATVTVDGVSVTPTSTAATTIVLPTQTFTSTGSKVVVVTTAGGSVNTAITVSNAAPVLSGINPATVQAGSAQITLTLTGSSFVANSVARWNGADLVTAYVSPTQLTATVPAGLLTTPGTFNVTVFNPTPGGGTSGANTFTVSAGPVPTISSIAPSTVVVNVATGAITITGTNLTSATVTVDGNAVTPTSNSATQIVLPSQTFTTTGNKTVVVTTVNGSANTSINVTGSLAGPPSVSSISPSTATVGVATGAITITGLDLGSATVTVDGNAVIPSSNTTTSIVLPSQTFTSAGSKTIVITTTGGSVNTAITVTAVAPSLTTLSPTSALAGGAQFVLTISGQNFVSGAVVRVNGAPRATSFVGTTQLTATIPAPDLAVAGTLAITVQNPDAQISNAISFPVNAAGAPTISSILPATVTPGSAAFTLAAIGTNFTNASQIQIGGVARATTYVSATRLETLITAPEVATSGTLAVSVTTAGVGTSGTVNLPVQTFNVNLPKLTPAFRAGKATLRIEQGKTFQAPIKITVGDSIVDLVNVTAVCQLRRKVADEELGVLPLVELNTTNGGLVIDAVNGFITINLTAAQTSALRFARCLFEIEATTPEGIVVGILRGDVRMGREIVR